MNKHCMFSLVLFTLALQEAYLSPCASRCPDVKGHIVNCALNKPAYLLDQKRAVSQLQCFDFCLRHPNCQVYNFKHESSYCELFRTLWSFDDESSLIAQKSTVFSWIARDQYNLWTMPCRQCQDMNTYEIEYCKKPLDMAFLVDISIKTDGEFELLKKFIVKVSNKFVQSSQYTKIGIVEYNANATITFTFYNFTTAIEFQRFLASVKREPGQTRYDRALHKAESELFSNQGGARPFAHRVVILISDSGLSQDAENIISMRTLKQSLKKKCVQVFAVGVDISSGDVAAITTLVDSDQNHFLQVKYFSQLDGDADSFARKICAAFP